jgi:hypothetical protein
MTGSELIVERPPIALLGVPFPVTFRATFGRPDDIIFCVLCVAEPDEFSFQLSRDRPCHVARLTKHPALVKVCHVVELQEGISFRSATIRQEFEVNWNRPIMGEFLRLPRTIWTGDRCLLELAIQLSAGLPFKIARIEAASHDSILEILPIELPLILSGREAFSVITFLKCSNAFEGERSLGTVVVWFEPAEFFSGEFSTSFVIPAMSVLISSIKVKLKVRPRYTRWTESHLVLSITNRDEDPVRVRIEVGDADGSNKAFLISGFLVFEVDVGARQTLDTQITFFPLESGERLFPRIAVYDLRYDYPRWTDCPMVLVI